MRVFPQIRSVVDMTLAVRNLEDIPQLLHPLGSDAIYCRHQRARYSGGHVCSHAIIEEYLCS